MNKIVGMPMKAIYNIDTRYVLVLCFAVLSSWILHEGAHFITGELLGNRMAMTFNKGYPVKGTYLESWHYLAVSAAGPLVTLAEAAIIYLVMMNRNIYWGYPFLFICFYMRFFAMVISLLNPNDEARISLAIGIGKFTLPFIVCVLLFYLVYRISRRCGFELKFNLFNLLLVIFFSSLIILFDQFFPVRLL